MTRAVNLASAGSIVSESVGDAPGYMARAWVNFNGTGTVAIRASGNVSSITDNGTGDYTVNFTTAMPDVNYAAVFGGGRDTTPSTVVGTCSFFAGTTTTQRLLTADSNLAAVDYVRAMVSIFR